MTNKIYSGIKQAGFTMIEVMVAAIIVACTVTAITFVIRTADRLKARALHLRAAAAIAQNSGEELRLTGPLATIAGDTIYTVMMHNVAYTCKRSLLDTVISAGSHEYALSIYTAADTALVREFRLRQGSAP